MGIDFGSKRVGVAVSDEGNTVAFPKEVIKNDESLLSRIGEYVREYSVTDIVLGESKNYQGEYNAVMEGVFRLKRGLEEELSVNVVLEPEFLTSAQAERQGKTDKLDASAAALILQSYLDKHNRNEHDNDR